MHPHGSYLQIRPKCTTAPLDLERSLQLSNIFLLRMIEPRIDFVNAFGVDDVKTFVVCLADRNRLLRSIQ